MDMEDNTYKDPIDYYVICHDPKLIADCEKTALGTLPNLHYVLVGRTSYPHSLDRKKIIVCNELIDNIEHLPHLCSFTAWYAIKRNRPATNRHICLLEYDSQLSQKFASVNAKLVERYSGSDFILGYSRARVNHPCYLQSTPYLEMCLKKHLKIDLKRFVATHKKRSPLWIPSTNVTLPYSIFSDFVEWFLPLTKYFRHDSLAAFVHERALYVYANLNQIDLQHAPDKMLEHSELRSHRFLDLYGFFLKDKKVPSLTNQLLFQHEAFYQYYLERLTGRPSGIRGLIEHVRSVQDNLSLANVILEAANGARELYRILKYRKGSNSTAARKKNLDLYRRYTFYSEPVESDFDETFYEQLYPEVADFHRPLCDRNEISNRHRLYRHYRGLKMARSFRTYKNEGELLRDCDCVIQKHFPLTTIPKVAVVIHAYYPDVWEEELSPEIRAIGIQRDLFITVPESNPALADKIAMEFPEANVFLVENRGSDVWPFISTLREEAYLQNRYDYILKLHTKKSSPNIALFTSYFRKNCYTNLCRNLTYILSKMEAGREFGMIGAPNSRVVLHALEDHTNREEFNYFRTKLGISDNRLDFIFGTMFVVRATLLEARLNDSSICKEAFQIGHAQDGTTAHAFERLFANIVRNENQKVVQLNDFSDFMIRS